jgi:hypothetical protein
MPPGASPAAFFMGAATRVQLERRDAAAVSDKAYRIM